MKPETIALIGTVLTVLGSVGLYRQFADALDALRRRLRKEVKASPSEIDDALFAPLDALLAGVSQKLRGDGITLADLEAAKRAADELRKQAEALRKQVKR